MVELLNNGWLLFAVLGIGTTFGAPSTNCVSWDDRIEPAMFQPLREMFKEYSSEYKNFTGADFSWFGFGVTWVGGTSGNYSSFRLNRVEGRNSTSFCELSGDRILFANLIFDELEAELRNVQLYTPVFSVGDFEPKVVFKGIKMFTYVNTTTDATTQHCNATLGWFLLEGFDSLHVETTAGWFTWATTKIFNWLVIPRLAAVLESYSENQSISFQVMQFLAPAVKAQQDFFCKAIR